MSSLLKYWHKWLEVVPSAAPCCGCNRARLRNQPGELYVFRASLTQWCEEQKRCLGSLCSWEEQCVAQEGSNEVSRVPSKQKEDAGL